MTVEHPSNRVLAALAQGPREQWTSHLERVDLLQGLTLQVPGAPIKFMYFPESALVGLLHAGRPGAPGAPVALVGNDGLVGVAPFLGTAAGHLRAEVLHPGFSWRLPTAALRSGSRPNDRQLRVVLGYLQALNTQMSLAALCRLEHTPFQRMGRWLQDAFGRVPDTTLRIQPGALSAWLGVAPKAVALATDQWVAEGAISCGARGITLLDRERLDRCSCGCHQKAHQHNMPLAPSAI